MSYENLNEVIENLLQYIAKLPEPPRERIRREIIEIKEMAVDSRPPRIIILGRRGSGKSSLINAIFKERVASVGSVVSETGKAEWHKYENKKGSIDILDTRGIGDRTKPESANSINALDDIKSEIENKCPDVILFLCKAKEVDAHIKEDIVNIQQIAKFIYQTHSYDAPVAALATQVDELDPKRIEPPYNDKTKKNNIKKAVDTLKDTFDDAKMELLTILPISAYAEYNAKGKMTYNNFWNIDELIEYMINGLPNEAQLQLARVSAIKKIQRKFARKIRDATAAVCSGIALVPIPFADIIPITTFQIGMITIIAYISGRTLSKNSAIEFLSALGVNVGAAFALRETARGLIKFVAPGAGLVVSAAIAGVGTVSIGEAAIAYFIERKSIEEAKKRFHETKDKESSDEESI